MLSLDFHTSEANCYSHPPQSKMEVDMQMVLITKSLRNDLQDLLWRCDFMKEKFCHYPTS